MGRIAIERQACVGRASASQTITETRSKGKAFDRCEIRIDRTIDIESAVTANGALTHHSRMVVFTFIEKRRGIIIAVLVLQQCAALIQSVLHVGRQFIGCVSIRSQGIHHQNGLQEATIRILRRYATGVILLNLVCRTYLQPRLYVVFGINGSRHTLVNIVFPFYNTVIVQISQRQIIIALLATSGKSQVMLHHQ